ncbi:MAG: NUDIX hydrolase [Leptospira sp.]|nr:NUDIX hydrolase [Leptospira sp.]
MEFFGTKKNLRVRVAALIPNQKNEILLIQQKKKNSSYWLLPGGGVEFGESLTEALGRELKEELNLELTNCDFLILNESIDPEKKRHIIQVVFSVEVKNLVPVISESEKSITGFGYFSRVEIKKMDLRPDMKNFLIKNAIIKKGNFVKSRWIAD